MTTTATTTTAAAEIDLLDQTQYLASKIYDDPGATPIPLDLFSACAIGNYECVQDAINSGLDINARNRGKAELKSFSNSLWLALIPLLSKE